MKKKFLFTILIIAGLLVMVSLISYFTYTYSFHQRLYGKPRKEWKETAISEIGRRATNSIWLSNEIATIKVDAKTNSEGGWLSEHLILMQNGEWMIYTNICNKQNARIHDLFIGHGSDGKWYYSTYHFCVGMIVLQMNPELQGQAENLQKFVWAYYLRPFDVHSDECFQETWNSNLWRKKNSL